MHSLGMAVTSSNLSHRAQSITAGIVPAERLNLLIPFQFRGRDLWLLRKLNHQDTACPYNYQVVSKGTARKLLQHLPTNPSGSGKRKQGRERSIV